MRLFVPKNNERMITKKEKEKDKEIATNEQCPSGTLLPP